MLSDLKTLFFGKSSGKHTYSNALFSFKIFHMTPDLTRVGANFYYKTYQLASGRNTININYICHPFIMDFICAGMENFKLKTQDKMFL